MSALGDVGEFIVILVKIPSADIIRYPMAGVTELILVVDRNSFDALKGLLREKSAQHALLGLSRRWKPPSDHAQREALKRLFDQIRDVNYDAS
jgi:hypothetical protein